MYKAESRPKRVSPVTGRGYKEQRSRTLERAGPEKPSRVVPRAVRPYGINGFYFWAGLAGGRSADCARRVGFVETNQGGTAEKKFRPFAGAAFFCLHGPILIRR